MSVSSGLLALPADIPAELLPLLLSQHLPESPIAGWVEEAALELEGLRCSRG